MVDRSELDPAVPARPPPSAEEWVQLHDRLHGIARECGSLPAAGVREFIATCAPELCGLTPEDLERGGSFDEQVAELEAYAAEFLAAALTGRAERDAPDMLREARIRSRFLGFHPKIAELRRTFVRYLGLPLPILLIGDRGSGKGALVRAAVHALDEKELFTVPLAGIPDSLAESELFGHRKGAFTGADRDRDGILRTASGRESNVYLDDVAECSASLQAKLLTALEEGVVRPVGSDREYSIGSGRNRRFRVMSSCHPASLRKLRTDLRDRLSALPLWVPPLRDRGADILLLATRVGELMSRRLGFGRKKFSAKACETLVRFEWPGNVRQLFNVVSRAIVRSQDGDAVVGRKMIAEIQREERLLSLSYEAAQADTVSLPAALDDWPTLAEVEDRYIARVLDATGARVTEAARILGIHRSTVRRRREKRDH
jgi:DNA-binding NtrC family response regulator